MFIQLPFSLTDNAAIVISAFVISLALSLGALIRNRQQILDRCMDIRKARNDGLAQ